MSAYQPVGWANDETHPLSQANMKTLDQGIVDVALPAAEAVVTTDGTDPLDLQLPGGAPQWYVTGKLKGQATGATLYDLSLRPLSGGSGIGVSGHRTERGLGTTALTFSDATTGDGNGIIVPELLQGGGTSSRWTTVHLWITRFDVQRVELSGWFTAQSSDPITVMARSYAVLTGAAPPDLLRVSGAGAADGFLAGSELYAYPQWI